MQQKVPVRNSYCLIIANVHVSVQVARPLLIILAYGILPYTTYHTTIRSDNNMVKQLLFATRIPGHVQPVVALECIML